MGRRGNQQTEQKSPMASQRIGLWEEGRRISARRAAISRRS
jgi:hypothetical protein